MSETQVNWDQWLVRTEKNRVHGPYRREEVKGLILSKKISLQDEVCAANHYWIFLHERDEIRKYLGIVVPQDSYPEEDEITQTDLPIPEHEAKTDPGIENRLQFGSASSNEPTLEREEITSVIRLNPKEVQTQGSSKVKSSESKSQSLAQSSAGSPSLGGSAPQGVGAKVGVGTNRPQWVRIGVGLLLVLVTVIASLWVLQK